MKQVGRARTLIFDFDGTLADTFHIAIEVVRQLAPKVRHADAAYIERMRGLPAKEILWSFGVRWWNLPYVIYRGRKAVRQSIQQGSAHPIDGIAPVLRQLHERGYKLYIVSSNSTKNIEHFLKQHKLLGYFQNVYGGHGVFSKAGALTALVRKNGWQLDECCYIGDEVRDIEAARLAAMPHAAVTWGYNNRTALERAHAERLADKPADLLALFPKHK